jgi:hypothetical protein
MYAHIPPQRLGEGQGLRWAVLPAFEGVVLAVVLVVLVFVGSYRGFRCPFSIVFVSAGRRRGPETGGEAGED